MYGTSILSHDKILIVACGPSADGIEPAEIAETGAFVIAVNHAILRVPAQAFFTCDPGDKVRVLFKKRVPGVQYFAAVPEDYGTPRAKTHAHREPRDEGVVYLRRLTGHGPWSHLRGLSEEPDAIHTGNSAYGALGLAYSMGARRIAFLGLDGNSGYGFGLKGSPGDLSHLPEIFKTAVPQLKRRGIEVFNGSKHSAITCFPRGTPQEALQWIS